jgi:hypothetical protein
MFNLFRKFFGYPTPEELAQNGQRFFEHLKKIDDSQISLDQIQNTFDFEGLGRLVRHAQQFPWRTDDELIAKWKSTVSSAFAGYDFFVEYREESAHENYLIFDVLRKPRTTPNSFSLNDTAAFVERDRVAADGRMYNYFMLHRPGEQGFALLYRLIHTAADGVLHVGTCEVYMNKRRLDALAEWDRQMSSSTPKRHVRKSA